MRIKNSRESNSPPFQDSPGRAGAQETRQDGAAVEAVIFPDAPALQERSLDAWRRLCLTCRRCSLRQEAKGVVFGEGNPRAQILFVGEGPGGEEDKLGRPFVGAAGQLLDRILAAANLAREEVYIANVVKCRPPGNRQPRKEEIEACLPLLQRQIELIDPAIIVCLGAVASRALIRPDFPITRERGCWQELDNRMLMPTFHPAALLRDPGKKKAVWEDIQLVVKLYTQICGEES
ncbi:MAG: uracil-DNA glycosylase [Bacillota bacterium]